MRPYPEPYKDPTAQLTLSSRRSAARWLAAPEAAATSMDTIQNPIRTLPLSLCSAEGGQQLAGMLRQELCDERVQRRHGAAFAGRDPMVL